VDRCALFIDAGYLLSEGAAAVHGTRHREQVSWDFDGLLKLLGELAGEHSGLPLLRCYWYESAVEGRRGPEHEALADLPAQQAPPRTSRRHLAPLIPAGHGMAALATFVLAVLSAISAR